MRSARENADRNGVGEIVRIEQGSVGDGEPFQGAYDLVVANIIARILIELAPSLANAVRTGGTLILGGIIDVKEAAVRDAFNESVSCSCGGKSLRTGFRWCCANPRCLPDVALPGSILPG